MLLNKARSDLDSSFQQNISPISPQNKIVEQICIQIQSLWNNMENTYNLQQSRCMFFLIQKMGETYYFIQITPAKLKVTQRIYSCIEGEDNLQGYYAFQPFTIPYKTDSLAATQCVCVARDKWMTFLQRKHFSYYFFFYINLEGLWHNVARDIWMTFLKKIFQQNQINQVAC